MSLALVFATAFLSTSMPQDPTATSVPEIVVPAPDNADRADEGLVCRSESIVGTNRRRRVCTTAAEREERRDRAVNTRDRLERDWNPLNPHDERNANPTGD